MTAKMTCQLSDPVSWLMVLMFFFDNFLAY